MRIIRRFSPFYIAFFSLLAVLLDSSAAYASEAELHIPPLNTIFNIFGSQVSGTSILMAGMVVSALGMVFGLVEFSRVRALPAHKSMLDISALIYETCKTYLFQQGKFLFVLELLILVDDQQ